MSTGDGSTNGVGEVRLADVEAALRRIPSVTAARIQTGPGGRITEVHIIARRDRSPKQLVRDVQSVALASFGVDVDYRTVSVVQMEGEEPAEQPSGGVEPSTRPRLLRVGSDVTGHATEVTVVVQHDGSELVGTARGPASIGHPLISRAVVNALAPLLGDVVVDPASARVVDAGDHQIAVCVLRSAGPARDIDVTGSAVVRRDPVDAIARATLAALNRSLGSSSHASDDVSAISQVNGPKA